MEGRRIRNPDTGEISYTNIEGSGLYDVFAKIGTKLTGKTAKKLATKAAEKMIEKGAEKTGELLGEKIYDKFSSRKNTEETKGKEIVNLLEKEIIPKVDKYKYIKDVYNDII